MSERIYKGKKVVHAEFRHATHVKSKESRDDLHVVKEILHFEDGTSEPALNFIKNYKRTAYIAKPGKRDYKEKRVREKLENLTKIEATESDIYYKVAKQLGLQFTGSVRSLLNSPHIYGLDITSTSVLASQYRKKYHSGKITPCSVAGFDIETNMLKPGNEITISTVSFKDRAVVTVTKDFVKGILNPEEAIRNTLDRLIGDTLKERNIKVQIKIVENEAMAVVETFKEVHKWQPDIISSWNQVYDLENSVRALEDAGIDPATVFSDPSVPKEYMYARWEEGLKEKKTDSGKLTSINMEERWNRMICPASFYFLDAMTVYSRVRAQSESKEEKYTLEHILKVNGLPGKLDIEEARHLLKGSPDWHKFLQRYYPLEYIAYNLIDCIVLEELDEKIKDLSTMVPSQCKFSDYFSFKSQPKRVTDALHWFALDRGYVLGTTGQRDSMTGGWNEYVVSIRDWIVNLDAHLMTPNPTNILKEIDKHLCSVYTYVYDLDIKSSYPTSVVVLNISKETTKSEVTKIDGVSYYMQCMQSLNLISGRCNGTEVAVDLFGLPKPDELLELYKKTKLKAA